MSEGILGNATGGFGFPRTYILTDNNGNELTGVYVESETIFTATDNDVREGMVYAGDSGVSTGTKVIPVYHSTEGAKLITNGNTLRITIPDYEYTKLQCIICAYNTNLQNSVSAQQVVINNSVYNVQSTEVISVVTNDIVNGNGSINLGITNTSGSPVVIRYFTFREVY